MLHGRLSTLFGPSHVLEVKTPAEAVRALIHLYPGFRQAIRPGSYRITKSGPASAVDLQPDELMLPMRPDAALHIRPVLEGSGGNGGGAAKAVLGVVLIGAALLTAGGALGIGFAAAGASSTTALGAVAGTGFATTVGLGIGSISAGSMALFGAAMLFSGVSQLLSPSPKPPQAHEVDLKPSFLFQGVTNTSAQGSPVPVVYGRFRVGSVIASSSIRAEDIASPITSDSAKSGVIHSFGW